MVRQPFQSRFALGLMPIAAWLFAGCAGEAGADPGRADEKPVPAKVRYTTMPAIKNGLVSLRGKPVVLNFWATWCAPCTEELKALATAHGEHGEGVELVTVSYDFLRPEMTRDKAHRLVQGFVNHTALPFPVWILDDTDSTALDKFLSLPGAIPCTVALDPAGREVNRIEGAADEAEFAAFFQALQPPG